MPPLLLLELLLPPLLLPEPPLLLELLPPLLLRCELLLDQLLLPLPLGLLPLGLLLGCWKRTGEASLHSTLRSPDFRSRCSGTTQRRNRHLVHLRSELRR